jgi:PAS domain-containing protein
MAGSPDVDVAAPAEQPLELILARNLISIVSVAAVLVDVDGGIVFFNDAAADIAGQRFEEVGALSADEWNAQYGPLDSEGRPVPLDELPLNVAVRESRPAYGRFWIRADRGLLEVEAAALPLVGPAGYHGAVVVFWPLGDGSPG